MAKRSDFYTLAALSIMFSYGVVFGATFDGILFPEFHLLTLGLMTGVIVLWLVMHWRRGWHWYRTSLDTVFLLWIVAFGASLVANTDAWRRIVIGLWYMGIYIGVWYVLHDLIANRALRREVVVDALLMAGFAIVLLGFLQLQVWLQQILTTGLFVVPPRPSSAFGNPNFLGNYLIILVPLTLTRLLQARSRLPRIILVLYLFMQVALLLLTLSRGAWIGLGVGLVIWFALIVARNGQISRNSMIEWWQTRATSIKYILVGAIVIGMIVIASISAVILRSFSDPARAAGLRLELYTAAIELFKEKPLTGQGLFTYGRGLVRLPDVHPDKPHSHAHNAPLHIAAELGVLGLVALVVTVFRCYRTIQANWHLSTARDRLLLAGVVGSIVAFAVHQLTDLPAMLPAIALTGLIVLVLAMAPTEPELVNATWAKVGHPVEMIGLWTVLLVAGFWSSGVYTNYVAVLSGATKTGNYRQGAERMDAVIASDPQLSLYSMEQGFLYGMAASKGDVEAAKAGIKSYERFIELDPSYAVVWANLAALRWQAGEEDEAIKAIQQAIHLDSVEWNYQVTLGQYAEAMGKTELANSAYQQALTLYPDASLYTELSSYVQANPKAFEPSKLSVAAQVVWLMRQGDLAGAEAVWQVVTPNSAPTYVISALLAIAKGDGDWAATALGVAEKLAATPVEEAWVHLGKSHLATFIGTNALAADELQAAQDAMKTDPLAADDETLINIAYAQFLQVTIKRQYLPQANYRKDPVLLYWLANTKP